MLLDRAPPLISLTRKVSLMNRVSVTFLTFLLLVACLSVPAYARSPRVRALNYTAPKDGPTERVYFYSRTRDEGKLLEVHRKLVDLGAHHVNCFLPTVVVCELPAGESAHALASDPDITVGSRLKHDGVQRQSRSQERWLPSNDSRHSHQSLK